MSKFENETEFINIIKDYTNENTLFNDTGSSDKLSNVLSAWLYDDNRKQNDKTILEDEDTLYLVLFLNKELREDETKTIRNIFIQKDTENAELIINEIYNSLLNENLNEENFSVFATLYSEDPTTANNGGLIDGIKEGQLIEPLNNWIFDNRKSGDCEIIESDLGYHILYFVKDSDVYWKYIAKQILIEEKYQDYLNKITEFL